MTGLGSDVLEGARADLHGHARGLTEFQPPTKSGTET
jgi:hypothetical protein